MRLTIANKLWLGFRILIPLLTITALIIASNVRLLDRALKKITTVEELTSAATYEMEINVFARVWARCSTWRSAGAVLLARRIRHA
ncbi:MAG: hypothetical protein H0W76_12640 [Pyrinomonadaceae bacterium]|nr:hypothetical protein [Pyrinomonadaceae bacterium]